MTEKKNKSVPLSLRRKSSSRLAAVQCVYRIRVNHENISAQALFDDYIAGWEEDKLLNERVISREAAPDKTLFFKILSTAIEHHDALEEIVKSSLNSKWTIERISPLLYALLSCAAAEIKYCSTNLSPAILINEYVTLAKRFFEDAEVGFVNAFLASIVK